MNSKQDLLLESISNYFINNRDKMDLLLEVIEGKYTSLRLIDWFVTNYSKKHNTSYITNVKTSTGVKEENFKVYNSYKAQLKSYSKKQFDPFNRTDRINFYYEKDRFITTTVGQLNFFRWAIQNNIVDFIQKHSGEIEEDMNSSVNYVYKKSDSGEKPSRKKRKELSVSAAKFLNKDDITILVKFN
jgi:hypothetical protein